MDMSERETRDFMNVESFSQLPFIRPPPPVSKEKGGAIRLFGKEFGSTSTTTTTTTCRVDENNNSAREGESNKDDNTETISSRKFECHYCCRNFPTSQALGGHQNAHKRERQHAKRAHLQSMMGISNQHDHYSLMNYNRSTLPISYHSWNSSSSSSSYTPNTRLYGSHASYNAHQPQPINGSPLTTTLWRGSSPFSRERASMPINPHIPLFNSQDDQLKQFSSSLSSQSRHGYESKPTMQDHVSLDLHL